MSTSISFFVQGDPKGQPRPRSFSMKLASGKTTTRMYDPHTAEGWKSLIAEAARRFVPSTPILGPIRMDEVFCFKRPLSHFLKSGLRANAPHFHTSKPDRDNCEKALLDCLTRLGFWKDDSQVCDGEVQKVYAEVPGVRITITPIIEW